MNLSPDFGEPYIKYDISGTSARGRTRLIIISHRPSYLHHFIMFKSALSVAALAVSVVAESSCPDSVITTTTSLAYSDITATYVTVTPTDYVTMSTATPTVYSTTVTASTTVEREGVYECAYTTTKYVSNKHP